MIFMLNLFSHHSSSSNTAAGVNFVHDWHNWRQTGIFFYLFLIEDPLRDNKKSIQTVIKFWLLDLHQKYEKP